MTIKSPTISVLNSLVFAAGSLTENNIERHLEQIEEFESNRTDETTLGCRRPSIYVEAFEDMVNRVHKFERHLLTEKEWDIFSTFSRLCYNARYCLVRLLLRKPDRWHTRASMETFTKEVSEEGLHRALSDICLPFDTLFKTEEMETDITLKEEPNTTDLLFDEQEEQKQAIVNAEAGPSGLGMNFIIGPSQTGELGLDNVSNHPGLDSSDPEIDFFCRDQTTMTLHEVLDKLSIDELKALIKSTRVKPRNPVKVSMISALMSHASNQSVLAFAPTVKKGNRNIRDGLHPAKLLPLPNNSKGKGKMTHQTQEARLMQIALEKLGTCVTLNPNFYRLIERVNILDERATLFPKSMLLPALLTCFKKRTYPDYKHTRTNNIWSTREELIQYVEALELEAVLDQELESQNERRKAGTKTPGPNAFVTPATPGPSRKNMSTPLRTPGSCSTIRYPETPASVKKGKAREDIAEGVNGDQEVVAPETLAKQERAERIKNIFDENIIHRWKALVVTKQQEARVRPSGLERFEPGFVYTRLFRRVQDALRTLKDFKAEAEVLEALLGQRHWRRRKRGTWYERRAILQTRHLCSVDGVKDLRVLSQAMEGVREALKDGDTGLVFRPSLLRRLRSLEKTLKVPVENRVPIECELRKAKIVLFNAVKLEKSLASLDTGLQQLPGEDEDVRKYFPQIPPKIERVSVAEKESNPEGKPPAKKPRLTGKSLWRGVNGEELNVEMRALQYYENLGFKGFHSESRILTMIFALVFWDIIFADIPGAFETPYQTAPLDLAEETFYYARKEMIDKRLEEVKQGQAQEILERHDDAYREKKTWCVGIQWDICEKQDLVEIVGCLGGETLSIICRLFCEDYEGRRSGVPDLVVWNAELRICKFVEVKGPGDRPQENQKLWFDSLLNAGAEVEICKVLDSNDETNATTGKRRRKSADQGSLKNKKVKVKSWDSDLESEAEGDQFANQPLTTPKPGPSSSGRKRPRPPDTGDDDSLPIFSMPKSPTSSLGLFSWRAGLAPSSKRQKLSS